MLLATQPPEAKVAHAHENKAVTPSVVCHNITHMDQLKTVLWYLYLGSDK